MLSKHILGSFENQRKVRTVLNTRVAIVRMKDVILHKQETLLWIKIRHSLFGIWKELFVKPYSKYQVKFLLVRPSESWVSHVWNFILSGMF